jgi:aldehyde:ferredoxin oxidoreductase
MGLYYLLRETQPGVDAYDPDNLLILAPSIITGAPFPGNARFSIVTKSPLTGGMGEAEAGGPWGPELKWAGWDAIVIRGRASYPVYLSIRDDDVKILPAQHLWGQDTLQTNETLINEVGDPKARTVTIGPGGEHLVRYALIAAGHHDVAGRTGVGAVMGSKNLKGIVVRGSQRIAVADSKRLNAITQWFARHYRRDPTNSFLSEYGTMGGPVLYGQMGALPTNNFQFGVMDDMEKISAEHIQEAGYYVGKTSCWGCPVACRKQTRVEAGPFRTQGVVHGPEYETLGSIASNCGVNDPEAAIRASELCDRLGIDSISSGVTIAWLMECADRGIVPRQVDGVRLEFGNGAAVCDLLEMIAYRRGIGDMLADGVRASAAAVGKGSESWAVHGKGQEIAAQDPRGYKIGAALGYAVGPTGGDHIQMEHDFQFARDDTKFFQDMQVLGVLRPLDPMDLGPEKTYLFTLNQKMWSLYNCLDICIFDAAPGHTFKLRHIRDVVESVTGWETSETELLRGGERGLTMARMFNLREGLSAKDDWLPQRLLEPLPRSAGVYGRIDPEQLRQAIHDYYVLMGWSADEGVPHRVTLESLGLGWISHE